MKEFIIGGFILVFIIYVLIIYFRDNVEEFQITFLKKWILEPFDENIFYCFMTYLISIVVLETILGAFLLVIIEFPIILILPLVLVIFYLLKKFKKK